MKSKVVLLGTFATLLPLLSPAFDLVKDGKAAEISKKWFDGQNVFILK